MYRSSVAGLGQSDGFVNPCGGMKWSTMEDGRIQLEDGSIPSYGVTSSQFGMLLGTWQNWESEFREAAERVGIPVEWLVATATIESGNLAKNKEKQRTVASFDGSIGIMQPLALVAQMFGYAPADRYDASANIDMGARLLKYNAQTPNGAYGFPVVAAMYNGGSGNGGCNVGNDPFNLKGYRRPGSTSATYVSNAIRYLNTAVEQGWAGKRSSLAMVGMGLGLAGLGVAGAIWIWSRRASLPS